MEGHLSSKGKSLCTAYIDTPTRRQTAVGARADGTRPDDGRGHPPDWRDVGQLQDELLNGEIFYTLEDAHVLIETWRRRDDTVRPHSSLGYRASE